MEVLRWDPLSDLNMLRNRIDRAFEESFSHAPVRREAAATAVWAPVVDIQEDENQITVQADLPGLAMENIDIEFTGDTLMIKGERPLAEDEKRKYLRVERAHGPFQRSFTIGIPINTDAIKASYRDGVLQVILPKAEETKPKKVEIQAE